MTRVVQSWPPNKTKILEIFPDLTGREIFAWAGTIYNPGGVSLSPELIAHEKVHFTQQGDDPYSWWARYLSDVQFRLDQEVESHRAEWQAYRRRVKNRSKRSKFLTQLSERLSSDLYGNLVTHTEARRLICI